MAGGACVRGERGRVRESRPLEEPGPAGAILTGAAVPAPALCSGLRDF